MSFLNRCVCVVFLFFVSVGIASASPVTPTGFFYPVGDDNPHVSGCGRWLTKPIPIGCYPSPDVYHIGVDIMADKETSVRAIADGEVLEPSFSGWSNDGTSDNIALLVKHHSVEEGDFVVLYGHILRAGAKAKGDSVKAGEVIAYVGHWIGGDHIHFGVLTPGLSYPPASGYGRWSYAKYGVSENGYFDNGFIDPIYFITHHGAKNSVSCAEQRNNLPDAITRGHVCFAELCPGVALDSRCSPSDTEMYTACVYEGSSLCAVTSSVWSATGHGASTSGSPEGSGGDTPPTPLPNLQIEEITVHVIPEGDDTRLTEERSVMNLGQTYQINVWPVSHSADCQNGNMTGNPDLEVKTDTFFKIALSEDEGTWQLLKRSETHCKYLAHGDFLVEGKPLCMCTNYPINLTKIDI